MLAVSLDNAAANNIRYALERSRRKWSRKVHCESKVSFGYFMVDLTGTVAPLPIPPKDHTSRDILFHKDNDNDI